MSEQSHFLKSSQPLDKLILLLAIFTANLCQFVHMSMLSNVIFSGLLLLSLVARSWSTVSCTLIFFVMRLYVRLSPTYLDGTPVIGFLVPFLVTAALLLTFSETRYNLRWVSRGRIDRLSWILVFLTSLFSTIALVLWAFWTNNLGLGEQFVKGLGHQSKLLIFLVFLPAFALLNALAEEVVYRGLVQESLSQVFRSPFLIIFLQASAFAAVHYSSGFPNGVVGYLMVLVYGTMLGYLRMRTKGILAPYVAHVIADATIAMLLVYLVK